MRTNALSLALIAVIVSSIGLFAATPSTHVDPNGNALPEPQVAGASADQETELAKQLQNPVVSLISAPFQNNFDFDLGPNDDGFRYTLNFQPVIPVSLGKDFNLIIRTIVPFIYQDDVIPNISQIGLGDIVQSFFFSPKKPVGGWIVALGPVLLWPTGTDELLGSEKWGAGLTGLVLKQTGGWTYGLLFNHICSYAGESSRAYVSSTFLQPFISYTKSKTTFGLNTESTYDWNAGQWTVPINFSIRPTNQDRKVANKLCVGSKNLRGRSERCT